VAVLLAVACASVAEPVTSSGEERKDRPAVAWLVRHAEKETGDDPGLTPAGQERARALAVRFERGGIERILATDTRRARETARPLAGALDLGIEIYEPSRLADLARSLRADRRTVLVVGHSNTTPELVRLLGGEPGPPMADTEYDRLYRVDLATGATEVESLAATTE
jgi:broad specificity phosphatase PhoE